MTDERIETTKKLIWILYRDMRGQEEVSLNAPRDWDSRLTAYLRKLVRDAKYEAVEAAARECASISKRLRASVGSRDNCVESRGADRCEDALELMLRKLALVEAE